MVVKNTEEADIDKKEQIMLYVRTISRRDFGGSVAMYFQHLTDTIDRLEAALSNVINERDQLKKDLHEAATKKGFLSICTYCAQKDVDYFDEPCKTCMENNKRTNFEWRGVVKDEQDDESKSSNPD